MSGLEVCGVVLGAIPLLISALEHYKDGKSMWDTFRQSRGLLSTLIIRLKVQQKFFYLEILDLLKAVGIDDVIGGDPTENECISILRDAKTSRHIQEYLGILYDSLLDTVRLYETCLKRIAAKLHHITRLPSASRDDLQSILECSTSGKISIKGKVSFTMKRDDLSALVEDLREDRLSIKEIVKKAKKTQQEEIPRQASHEAQMMAQKFDRVRQAALSLYPAICNACTCTCEEHRVLIRLDHRTTLKGVKKSYGKGTSSNTTFNVMIDWEGELQEAYIEASSYAAAPAPDFSGPRENIAKKTRLEVPVITLSESIASPHLYEQVTNICESIREATAACRHLNLQLAHTRLMVGGHREYQEPHRAPVSATSLYSFLLKHAPDDDLRLTPKQKTSLALEAASSVLQLRQTRWLSRGISSESLKLSLLPDEQEAIFFSYMEQSIHRCTKESVDGADELDPKSLLLDLAILLLEIWNHKPIGLCAEKMGVQVADSPEAKRIAAIRWVEKSSNHLPLNHLKAIEQCLAVCSGRLRFWHEKEFQRLYCENIIKPLKENCDALDTEKQAGILVY